MECLCSPFSLRWSDIANMTMAVLGAHVNAGKLCGPVVKSRSQPQHRIDGGKYEAMQ